MSVRTGPLGGIKLYKIFRSLQDQKLTGLLTLRRGQIVKRVRLSSGVPVRVSSNARRETSTVCLHEQGLLSSEDVDAAAKLKAKSGCTAEEALVRLGFLDARQLRALEVKLSRRRLLECFTWREGEFTFAEGTHKPDSDCQDIDVVGLLIDASAKLASDEDCLSFVGAFVDQPVKLTARVGTYGAMFDVAVGVPNLRSALGEPQTVDQLIETLKDPERVRRQVFSLVICGLASFQAAVKSPGLPSPRVVPVPVPVPVVVDAPVPLVVDAPVPLVVDAPVPNPVVAAAPLPAAVVFARRTKPPAAVVEAATTDPSPPPVVPLETIPAPAPAPEPVPEPVPQPQPTPKPPEPAPPEPAPTPKPPEPAPAPPEPAPKPKPPEPAPTPKPPEPAPKPAPKPAPLSASGSLTGPPVPAIRKRAEVLRNARPLDENARRTLAEVDALHGILRKKSHYEIIALPKSVDVKSVHAQFRRLARDFHVDRFTKYGLSAEQMKKVQDVFMAINRAHEVLSSPEQRRDYDLQLDMAARGQKVPSNASPDVGLIFRAEQLVKDGTTLLRNNKAEAAKAKFEEALGSTPGDVVARAGAAYSEFLLSIGAKNEPRAAAAQVALEAVVTADVARDEPYLYLGRVYKLRGQDSRAIAQFQRALEVNPHCNEAGSELRHLQRRSDASPSTEKGAAGLFNRKKS